MRITNHVYFYPSESGHIEPSNTIIITGNDKQIMIDPGMNSGKRLNRLISDIEKDGLDIEQTSEIWLTHSHIDHFQIVHELFKRLGIEKIIRCHQSGQKILKATNLKDAFIVQEVKKAGKYWKMLLIPEDRKKQNVSGSTVVDAIDMLIVKGMPLFWRKITSIKPFFNGEVVDVSPIEIKIIDLPGHTPNEIGFWISKERVLILGDLVNVFQRGGRTDCKLILYNFFADLDQALDSLNKMKQIRKKPKILLTPHSVPVIGKKNIQRIFDQLIYKINIYKFIAEEFIKKNPNLSGVRLVKEFAEILPNGNLFLTEKRFTALAVLKSLGAIK